MRGDGYWASSEKLHQRHMEGKASFHPYVVQRSLEETRSLPTKKEKKLKQASARRKILSLSHTVVVSLVALVRGRSSTILFPLGGWIFN